MADNVPITAGSGTTISTDDVSGVHYQNVKLNVGGDGVSVPVIGGATASGLLPVGGLMARVTQTPTVSTSPAYTAKDAVGGLLTFANAARVSGGSIIIESATLLDNSQQMPLLELALFDQTFTASSDNAVFNPSDADLANLIGVVKFSDWADFSTNSATTRTSLGLAAKLVGTSLFGQLLTRSTPTFVATSDIAVILHIRQH